MLSNLMATIASSSSSTNPGVQRFNSTLADFLYKLKRHGKGLGKKSISRLDKLIDLVESDSSIPIEMFRSATKRDEVRKMIAKSDDNLFKAIPLVDRKDYASLNEKTKVASWKYIKKLTKIVDQTPPSTEISSMISQAIGDLDVDAIKESAFGYLDKVKSIFKRNEVDEKKFLDITESCVEAIPSVGELQPKKYAGKVRKYAQTIFFGDTDEVMKLCEN